MNDSPGAAAPYYPQMSPRRTCSETPRRRPDIISARVSALRYLRRRPLQHVHSRQRQPALLAAHRDNKLGFGQYDPLAVATVDVEVFGRTLRAEHSLDVPTCRARPRDHGYRRTLMKAAVAVRAVNHLADVDASALQSCRYVNAKPRGYASASVLGTAMLAAKSRGDRVRKHLGTISPPRFDARYVRVRETPVAGSW